VLIVLEKKSRGTAIKETVTEANSDSVDDSASEGWVEGSIKVSIYYEDTDFSGYVYHANFLKYFERGREELFGIPFVKDLYAEGIHFVVARVNMSFHQPAKHGDILLIKSRIRLSESPISVVKHTATLSQADDLRSSDPLVSATLKLVCVDGKGQMRRIPSKVIERFSPGD
jgi:acyl-CoA thioester hydrolase